MPLNEEIIGGSNPESEMEQEVNGSTAHEALRDTLNHVILAQQSALEILTNLCCDDSNYEECSETDDDEDNINGNFSGGPSMIDSILICQIWTSPFPFLLS